MSMWKEQWNSRIMDTRKASCCSNYGVEGISYEMVDGKPEWTELITNDPEGRNWPNIRRPVRFIWGRTGVTGLLSCN